MTDDSTQAKPESRKASDVQSVSDNLNENRFSRWLAISGIQGNAW